MCQYPKLADRDDMGRTLGLKLGGLFSSIIAICSCVSPPMTSPEARYLGSTLEEVSVQIDPTEPLCVGQVVNVQVRATYELRARYGLVRVFVQNAAVQLDVLGKDEVQALPGRNVANLKTRVTVPPTDKILVYVPLFEEDIRPTRVVKTMSYSVQPAARCSP